MMPITDRLMRGVLFFAVWAVVGVTVTSAQDRGGSGPARQGTAKKRLLLLAQKPDNHPPGTHEYYPGLNLLQICLARHPDVETELVSADGDWPEGPERIGRADGVVVFLNEGGRFVTEERKRYAAFVELARRKGGFVSLHWGMGSKEAGPIDEFVALFGGCHGGPDRKYQVIGAKLAAVAEAKTHPVLRGVDAVEVEDEFYYRLKFPKERRDHSPLLAVRIDGETHTVAWAWERPQGGRSFGFSGLHFHRNWEKPTYRRLIVQGTLWSLGLDIPAQGVPVDVKAEDLQLKR